MIKQLLSLSFALVLTSGVFADSFDFSAVNGGAALGSTKLNLNNLALGNATQWADANVKVSFLGTANAVQGASSGYYAAPFVSGSNGVGFGSPNQPNGVDTTTYLSTGIGSVVFDFTSAQTYFGLLWGSVDNYNSLYFYDGADLVGSFTGTDIWAIANGNQGAQGTFYVNFDDLDGTFNKVVAHSTGYAFELDNIAYNNSTVRVPDAGATLALIGLSLIGLISIRRKR